MCHKQTFTGASTHLTASLLGGFQGKVSCAMAVGHQKSTIVLSVRCSPIYSEWVTNHEACARLQSQTTAAAISSGRPSRPIGLLVECVGFGRRPFMLLA
jgi:hypothetical protein